MHSPKLTGTFARGHARTYEGKNRTSHGAKLKYPASNREPPLSIKNTYLRSPMADVGSKLSNYATDGF